MTFDDAWAALQEAGAAHRKAETAYGNLEAALADARAAYSDAQAVYRDTKAALEVARAAVHLAARMTDRTGDVAMNELDPHGDAWVARLRAADLRRQGKLMIAGTDTCTLCHPADHTVESHPECPGCGGTWMPMQATGQCADCDEDDA